MDLKNSLKKLEQQQTQQQIILRELNQFIRKEPDQIGARKLQKYSKNSDLSYAETLITAAKRYFGQALKQWSKYEEKIEEHLSNFINNFHTKIFYSKLAHLQYIFKPLRDLYKRITKRQVILLSEDALLQQSDKVIQKHVKQKEAQIQKTQNIQSEGGHTFESEIYQKQNKSSSQQVLVPLKFLGNKPESFRAEVWKQIFFKVSLFYSPFFRLFSNMSAKLSKQKQKSNYLQNGNSDKNSKKLQDTIQWKQLQSTDQPSVNYGDCACCLSYVYEDQDLSFPTFPQPVAFLGKIVGYAVMQQKIKGQIVSFLNGKGGVIFLGCKRAKDGCILPHLDVTLQSDKSKAQDAFRSYIDDIFPSIQLKRHIDLSWIPVAQSVANSPKRQITWLSGVYILRIVVNPLEPQNTYHYKYQENFYFTRQSSIGVVQLKKEQIYQFMKKKYIQYKVKVVGELRERGNLNPTVIKHNGACRGVEKGKPDFGAYPQIERAQNLIQGKVSNPLLTDRSTYKSVSLLVVDYGLIAQIKKIFNQKQKLESAIDKAFPQKNFRLSNNTWLVWHNVKFQKLMAGLKKEQNQLKQKNSRKPPLLISTCPCLKTLQNGTLPKQTIEDIIQFAKKQSKQNVEYKNICDYDYFKTTSTITAVLIYYYLNHKYQIKSVFQKIPTGSEMKQKHVKGNQARLGPAYNQKKAKTIRLPDNNVNQQQDYENNHEQYEEQPQEQHSPSRNQNRAQPYKQQYYQNTNGYNQLAYSQHQVTPNVIQSRYDEYYNLWQYCDNGIVYFYNSQNVYIGSRVYEEWQLQQQQQQPQQYQYYS